MTLRKLFQDLIGVDGDPGNLDREVFVRIVRRRRGDAGGKDVVGGVIAEKHVPISRVSIFHGNSFTPAVDIVIEQGELDAAKEVLR